MDNYNCYIHIPFCELKCKYCRFASIGNIQNLHIEKYVNFLCKEILQSNFKIKELNTIYFGGGTPSVLKEKHLKEILNILKSKYSFSKNIEITIESTPNNINLENLKIWEKLKINRISIGLQTLNKKSLKEINRGNKGNIEKCFLNLNNYFKNNGIIKNINFDFIIGLPYVKKGEILENIKYIFKNYNFVKHISVYMLEDYYNLDKIIETKYDNITYPKDWNNFGLKEDEFLEEYVGIKNYLINLGFNNYEISNFAKSGFECKHNIGYWNHKETLAFGMGASGFINQKRYLNADNFKDYYKGEKIFEEKLSKYDLFLEKLMFGLRTSGIKKEIYEKLDKEKVDYFIKNGYLKKELDKITLSNSGILLMDYILKEII